MLTRFRNKNVRSQQINAETTLRSMFAFESQHDIYNNRLTQDEKNILLNLNTTQALAYISFIIFADNHPNVLTQAEQNELSNLCDEITDLTNLMNFLGTNYQHLPLISSKNIIASPTDRSLSDLLAQQRSASKSSPSIRDASSPSKKLLTEFDDAADNAASSSYPSSLRLG